MVYLVIGFILINNFTLQSTELSRGATKIPEAWPEESIPVNNVTLHHVAIPLETSFPSSWDLVTHVNFIKNFLKVAPQELYGDKKVFNEHAILKWNGFTNPIIMAHAQQRIRELNFNLAPHSPQTTSMYLQLLKELVLCSQSHNEKQKRKLRTQILTGILGIGITIGTSFATRYIP